MGVISLTSFVAQHTSLQHALTLTQQSQPINFIFDANAFLYNLATSTGDYTALRADLRAVLASLESVNVKSCFVFDGVCETSKLETSKSRSKLAIKKSIQPMGYVTSRRPPLISLPPLLYLAVIDELKILKVEMIFAEGEADGVVASLASQRRGYAVSQDSDFFIFNAEHCLGYIPLNTISFSTSPTHSPASIPPSERSISFTFYRYQDLAALFGLPFTFLPFLASLVGNDTTTSTIRKFEKKDILKVAQELSKVQHLSLNDSVQIFTTVQLNLETEPAPVEELLLATKSYDLSPPSLDFPFAPRVSDSSRIVKCRREYYEAYLKGNIGKEILMILKHGIYLNNYHFDDSSRLSPIVQLGRPLRVWIYAILGEDLGFEGIDGMVTEWVRRGADLNEAAIEVAGLEEEQGKLLRTKEERLELFYQIFDLESNLNPPSFIYLPLIVALCHIQSFAKITWTRHELLAAIITAVLSIQSIRPSLLPILPSLNHFQKSTELVVVVQHVSLLLQVLRIEEFGSLDKLFEESVFVYLLSLEKKIEGYLDRLDTEIKKLVMELLRQLQ